jgi:hypothetical protein
MGLFHFTVNEIPGTVMKRDGLGGRDRQGQKGHRKAVCIGVS